MTDADHDASAIALLRGDVALWRTLTQMLLTRVADLERSNRSLRAEITERTQTWVKPNDIPAVS
jgi:hypothetical protein